jgi:uncharacterized protein YndB with AHSA1/START domain
LRIIMAARATKRNLEVADRLALMEHNSTMPARPDEVWEVLTDPDGVASWLGDGSDLPPVEGADLDVADVETGVRRVGTVESVEPGRRLGFVWWPADSEGRDDGAAGDRATRVEITLVPDGDHTHLTITEVPVSRTEAVTASVADAHAWAWRAAGAELGLLRRAIGSGLTLVC